MFEIVIMSPHKLYLNVHAGRLKGGGAGWQVFSMNYQDTRSPFNWTKVHTETTVRKGVT